MFFSTLNTWRKSFFSNKSTSTIKTLNFSPLVYRLESPKYQLFDLHNENRFSGWVFYFGEKIITSLSVAFDHKWAGNFPVNQPRPDVSIYVPSISAAQTCGFDFILPAPSAHTRCIQVDVIYTDHTRENLLNYEVGQVRLLKNKLDDYQTQLQSIPIPNGELVFLTQGHTQSEEYSSNIIPALLTMQSYLEKSGIEIQKIETLLDFGCGSGRLLAGWHIISPHVELFGCDLNARLIQWTQQNLPLAIQCQPNNLIPPLPYQNDQFDLIYLISVFTHLSKATQKQWIKELKRILRPNGYILITLHGLLYVKNAFHHQPDQIQSFIDQGYLENELENVEGSNQFCTFHHYSFVQELFSDFELIGFFPNGNDQQQNTVFQIAQSQDVYVLQFVGRNY